MDDEHAARLRAHRFDPLLRLGVPLLAGALTAAGSGVGGLSVLLLVPFLVLCAFGLLLPRSVVIGLSVALVGFEWWMLRAVESSTSSTAGIALIFIPFELCAVPLAAIFIVLTVRFVRLMLRFYRDFCSSPKPHSRQT